MPFIDFRTLGGAANIANPYKSSETKTTVRTSSGAIPAFVETDTRGLDCDAETVIEFEAPCSRIELFAFNMGSASVSFFMNGSLAGTDAVSNGPSGARVIFDKAVVDMAVLRANDELRLSTVYGASAPGRKVRSKSAAGPRRKNVKMATAAKTIGDLDLADYVRQAAEALLAAWPSVVFTSGRRDVAGQARAMASNVVGNRRWIEQTYAASAERDALQAWVDSHPEASNSSAIAAGLEMVMAAWTDAQKARLSRHFSGEAFDVQPVSGSTGDQIKTTIRGLPRLRRFLESEGGKTIWHAEFQ